MDFLIKIFKALANEHRVKLLHTLMKKGEKEISELAHEIGIPYKTAARKLKNLRADQSRPQPKMAGIGLLLLKE